MKIFENSSINNLNIIERSYFIYILKIFLKNKIIIML